MLSHDFKAPIRTIVSFSTLLKERINDKLENDEFRWMDFINNSARNLSDVVDGMLKLAMASDNKLLIKEDINLNVLLEQTIHLLHPPKEFQFKFAETLPSVHTSKIALQQILLNLLSNAIRYNDKELGKVDIDFSQDDFYYYFKVADNGTGIAPEYIEKVFHPLQTLNEKDRFGQKGSGIGLATVMRIIEKLDGNIMVASEVGVGSTFKFKISK
jgi:signal transduction histidine kinase